MAVGNLISYVGANMDNLIDMSQSQHKVLNVDFNAKLLQRRGELRAVCFSDTHKRIKFSLPKCHFAICAGDVCAMGREDDFREFISWYAKQDAVHKIYVPGNHDIFCEQKPDFVINICKANDVHYLHNTGITLSGINFWGTATQPFFCNWAFNVIDARDRARDFALIPDDTEVLITHCPPYGILDNTPPSVWNNFSTEEHVGCHALMSAVGRVKPRFHIFGHIHCAYGQFRRSGTLFVNASICTEQYKQLNAPVVIDLNEWPEPITFEGV